jgi:argininosuccinate lyase
VGRAVAAASGPQSLDAAALDAAAREVLGRGLALEDALVRDALDPEACLAARTSPGGAAPEPMDAMLAECRHALEDAREWAEAQRAAIDRAEAALLQRARAASGSSSSVS